MGRAALWHIVWDSRNACYQLSEQIEQGIIPAKIPGCATRGDSGLLRAGGSRSRRVRVTLCDSLDHLTGPEHHRNAGLGPGAGAFTSDQVLRACVPAHVSLWVCQPGRTETPSLQTREPPSEEAGVKEEIIGHGT